MCSFQKLPGGWGAENPSLQKCCLPVPPHAQRRHPSVRALRDGPSGTGSVHALHVLTHYASQPVALLTGTFGNSWGNFELPPRGGWEKGFRTAGSCSWAWWQQDAAECPPLRRPAHSQGAGSGAHGALFNSWTSFAWSLVIGCREAQCAVFLVSNSSRTPLGWPGACRLTCGPVWRGIDV